MRLQRRVAALLGSPAAEWPIIAAEPADVRSLYLHYIVPLSAIPSVAYLGGLLLIGGRFVGAFGIQIAIGGALASYAFALVWPLLTAMLMSRLAPRFGASGDTARALTVVAYAATPYWLAGVCYLLLPLSRVVALGAVWGVYLAYLGLPPVMKAPHEQVVPFMVVSVIAVVVVNIVLQMLLVSTLRGIPYF